MKSYQDKIDLSKLNAEKTIKFDMIFSQEDLLQIANDRFKICPLPNQNMVWVGLL